MVAFLITALALFGIISCGITLAGKLVDQSKAMVAKTKTKIENRRAKRNAVEG